MANQKIARDEARQGLALPNPALRRLQEAGIFVRSAVSLEHQHLAHRYVIRGVESGGAVEALGHYVTFCGATGEPLVWLHPLDAIGVDGVHAVVVAPTLVRVEMFRRGHTYDLLITRHAPAEAVNGKRPVLESVVLFRAREGHLASDLLGKDRDQRNCSAPSFFTRSGEPLAIPAEFDEVVKAATKAVNCVSCVHAHYLRAPENGSNSGV